MTREQFLIESIQKASTPYLNAFDHRYYKATLVDDNLRFLTCSNLDYNDWQKVAVFPAGQYIEVKAEQPTFEEKWIANVEQYADERGADKISEHHKNCLRREAHLIASYVQEQIDKLRRELKD